VPLSLDAVEFIWALAIGPALIVAPADRWVLWCRHRTHQCCGPVPSGHLYGLLLTFGLALIIQGLFRNYYGISGLPYQIPAVAFRAEQNLGFMFLPNSGAWVGWSRPVLVVLCHWFAIEKTRLGAYLSRCEQEKIRRSWRVGRECFR